MVWNKEKDLDKAVWVNQIVLFLQSFCFTIELLALQANNIKWCHSRSYRSCLTHFGLTCPLKISKIFDFLMFFKGYKKLTLTSTGLILIVYRKYNVLQSIYFEKLLTEKKSYISKIWNFKFRIFNSKSISRIL